MKRDPDLLREILLVIEASPSAELLQLPAFNDHAPPAVRFHVRLLIEARLVHAIAGVQRADPNWFALRLSWQGYDYLETIRDPRIWRLTKKAAAKTGSWSLETMGAIAKAAALAKAQSLGLALMP